MSAIGNDGARASFHQEPNMLLDLLPPGKMKIGPIGNDGTIQITLKIGEGQHATDLSLRIPIDRSKKTVEGLQKAIEKALVIHEIASLKLQFLSGDKRETTEQAAAQFKDEFSEAASIKTERTFFGFGKIKGLLVTKKDSSKVYSRLKDIQGPMCGSGIDQKLIRELAYSIAKDIIKPTSKPTTDIATPSKDQTTFIKKDGAQEPTLLPEIRSAINSATRGIDGKVKYLRQLGQYWQSILESSEPSEKPVHDYASYIKRIESVIATNIPLLTNELITSAQNLTKAQLKLEISAKLSSYSSAYTPEEKEALQKTLVKCKTKFQLQLRDFKRFIASTQLLPQESVRQLSHMAIKKRLKTTTSASVSQYQEASLALIEPEKEPLFLKKINSKDFHKIQQEADKLLYASTLEKVLKNQTQPLSLSQLAKKCVEISLEKGNAALSISETPSEQELRSMEDQFYKYIERQAFSLKRKEGKTLGEIEHSVIPTMVPSSKFLNKMKAASNEEVFLLRDFLEECTKPFDEQGLSLFSPENHEDLITHAFLFSDAVRTLSHQFNKLKSKYEQNSTSAQSYIDSLAKLAHLDHTRKSPVTRTPVIEDRALESSEER